MVTKGSGYTGGDGDTDGGGGGDTEPESTARQTQRPGDIDRIPGDPGGGGDPDPQPERPPDNIDQIPGDPGSDTDPDPGPSRPDPDPTPPDNIDQIPGDPGADSDTDAGPSRPDPDPSPPDNIDQIPGDPGADSDTDAGPSRPDPADPGLVNDPIHDDPGPDPTPPRGQPTPVDAGADDVSPETRDLYLDRAGDPGQGPIDPGLEEDPSRVDELDDEYQFEDTTAAEYVSQRRVELTDAGYEPDEFSIRFDEDQGLYVEYDEELVDARRRDELRQDAASELDAFGAGDLGVREVEEDGETVLEPFVTDAAISDYEAEQVEDQRLDLAAELGISPQDVEMREVGPESGEPSRPGMDLDTVMRPDVTQEGEISLLADQLDVDESDLQADETTGTIGLTPDAEREMVAEREGVDADQLERDPETGDFTYTTTEVQREEGGLTAPGLVEGAAGAIGAHPIYGGLIDATGDAVDDASGALQDVEDAAIGREDTAVERGEEFAADLREAGGDAVSTAAGFVPEPAADAYDAGAGVVGDAGEFVGEQVDTAVGGTADVAGDASEMAGDAIDGIGARMPEPAESDLSDGVAGGPGPAPGAGDTDIEYDTDVPDTSPPAGWTSPRATDPEDAQEPEVAGEVLLDRGVEGAADVAAGASDALDTPLGERTDRTLGDLVLGVGPAGTVRQVGSRGAARGGQFVDDAIRVGDDVLGGVRAAASNVDARNVVAGAGVAGGFVVGAQQDGAEEETVPEDVVYERPEIDVPDTAVGQATGEIPIPEQDVGITAPDVGVPEGGAVRGEPELPVPEGGTTYDQGEMPIPDTTEQVDPTGIRADVINEGVVREGAPYEPVVSEGTVWEGSVSRRIREISPDTGGTGYLSAAELIQRPEQERPPFQREEATTTITGEDIVSRDRVLLPEERTQEAIDIGRGVPRGQWARELDRGELPATDLPRPSEQQVVEPEPTGFDTPGGELFDATFTEPTLGYGTGVSGPQPLGVGGVEAASTQEEAAAEATGQMDATAQVQAQSPAMDTMADLAAPRLQPAQPDMSMDLTPEQVAEPEGYGFGFGQGIGRTRRPRGMPFPSLDEEEEDAAGDLAIEQETIQNPIAGALDVLGVGGSGGDTGDAPDPFAAIGGGDGTMPMGGPVGWGDDDDDEEPDIGGHLL